jgi:hypothetical protein
MSADIFSSYIVMGDLDNFKSSHHIVCHVGTDKFGILFVKAIPEA